MEFFKVGTNIDFLGLRLWAAIFSVCLFLFSLGSLAFHGLNLGLDFTGGTQIELNFKQAPDLNVMRQNLINANFTDFQVQSFGDSKDVVITLGLNKKAQEASPKDQKAAQDALVQAVLKQVPGATVSSADFIGATVSSELASKGVLAVLMALFATILYIAFRFEWRLAVGAAVALIHDPVLILGVFSVLHLEFDLTALAAVLTIIGYSLHDTIVVFDRVRENFRKMRHGSSIEIMNAAINQTLSRTIISSGLTLIVVLVLFLLGGPSIHAFSLALLIGILVGTYSSIYVAGSLAVALGLKRTDLLKAAKKDYSDRP